MSTRPKFVVNQESAKAIIMKRGKAGIVQGEGKFSAKVSSANPFVRNAGLPNEQRIIIVNFHLMSEYHMRKSMTAFAAGAYAASIGSGTSFSASVLEDQYVPVKGETVNVQIEEIYSEKQGTNILVINGIFEVKLTKNKAYLDGDLDKFDEVVASFQATAEEKEATDAGLAEEAEAKAKELEKSIL